MKNSDMPAMPLATDFQMYVDQKDHSKGMTPAFGLTKLEHFAGLAMQACRTRKSEYKDWEDLAADAVEIAKALLEELEKQK